jgi:outer membrane biosynthesis protein TonB
MRRITMFRINKIWIFIGSVAFSFGILSIGYGYWTDKLDIEGNADVKYSLNVIDDVEEETPSPEAIELIVNPELAPAETPASPETPAPAVTEPQIPEPEPAVTPVTDPVPDPEPEPEPTVTSEPEPEPASQAADTDTPADTGGTGETIVE